ncbi:VCBS domain-containing protein [Limnohabitans sp. 2KL-1]|uniref:VCBS domain-containing protein n=1 Tax=Limnohabitans sp. 2KL-1 TaxID=1100699 RepID=UPI001304AC2E|nr:VCBS domain-containing protein [Limnohabitans sp. 2KL-1]
MNNQIIFALDNLTDLDTLLAGLPAGAELHLLDGRGDALAQMAQILQGHSDVTALHLFSHGGPASLSLGSLTLDATNLSSHADTLAIIGAALTTDADWLIYGCDVAQGDTGQAFVAALADLTGADVAASSDLTGAAALGGDWVLEQQTGAIETNVALSDAAMVGYGALLIGGITGVSTASLTETNEVLSTGGKLDSSESFDPITMVAGSSGRGWFSIDTTGAWTYVTAAPHDTYVGGTTYTDTITVSTATFSQNITVSILGTNDAAVISGTSTASLTETNIALTASGTLTSTDVDGTANLFIAQTDAAGSNSYGKFSIGTNGAWTYTANDAHNEFVSGQTYTDSVTVATADGTQQVITVSILGTNDAAVISGTSTGAVLEAGGTTNGTVGTPTATGTLTDTDVDNTADTFTAVSTATASTGGYGTYTMTAGGAWTYTLNNNNVTVQALAASATLSDTFTVTTADGTPQVVTITITGSNDAAVISGTSTGAVVEAGGVANATTGTPTATGTLTDTDVDNTANTFTAVSSATASTGGYGTYTMTAAGVWTYTLDNNNATVQALAASATLSDTFTVTTADGTPQVVTITITGSNDAPVISVGGSDSAAKTLTETNAALSTSGTLSVTDVDLTNTVTAQVFSVAKSDTTTGITPDDATLKGYLTLASASIIDASHTAGTISWTFNSASEAFNYLAAGEHLTLTYTVRVTDSSADTADQTVVVTITGTNDAPVISVGGSDSATKTLTETNSALSTSGTLSVTDVDLTNTVTAQVLSVAKGYSITGITPSDATLKGYLTLASTSIIDATQTTGTISWSFNSASEAFNYLADGELLRLTYVVRVTDSSSSTADRNVVITITGTNDAPVISVGGSDSAAKTLTETNAALSTSGTLSVTDVDLTNTVTAQVLSVVKSDATTGITPDDATLKGYLTLASASIIDDGQTTGTINWSFNSTSEAFDYLAAGEHLTLTYTVRVTDSSLATADQTVVVTITGTNDVPVVTNASTDAEGTVIEAGHTDAGVVVDGTVTATGTLTSSDVDTGATKTWSLQGTPSTTYGSIALNSSTGVWTYTLANSDTDTQALAEGASVNETYTVRVTDDKGAYVDQTVTITITGTNDVPVVTNDSAARSGNVTEAGHTDAGVVVDGTVTATGTLTSSDVDTGATKTWSLQGTPSTTYGSIALVANTGVWTYTLNNSLVATQALKEGETVTQSYTARVTDDFGAYVDQTITVTINGNNDVPVVTNAGSALLGSVTEAGHTDPGVVVAGTATATGTLTSSDVDASATKTWTIADATPSTTYGSIAIVSGTGVWTYTLNNSLAATQALKEGETVTQSYTARVTDDFGAYVDQTITVTINGTNDVPVVTNAGSALLGSVTEAGHTDPGVVVAGTATATGTLTSSDVDASATKTWTIADATPSTTYGSIAIVSGTGVWTYTLNNSLAATQALKEGESVTQTYTARVTDDFGAYADQTITVTINGTNDVPVVTNLAADRAGSVTEAGHTDPGVVVAGTATATGTLTSSDVDASATKAWSLQGTPSTTYGSIALVADTGVWTYTLDNSLAATQALKEGQSVTQTYTARVTDDFGAYVDQTITVTINGTNDVPVVTNAGSALLGSVTEAGHEDDGTVVVGTATATGTLTSSDVDASATKTWTIADATPSTTYGSIAIVSGTGVWTYTLNNSLAATQALKEGESVTQTYTARVTDDFGAYVDQTITVTINGTNDVPVVTNAGSALLGSVTEAGHTDPGVVVAGTATATGTLTSSDVDAAATKVWSLQGTPSTTYGSIALVADTGVWTYTLDNSLAATQALKEGQSVTQTYTARVTDDFGAYVDQTITVTINGTNDVPVVTNAGSALLGSVTEAGHEDDGTVVAGTVTATGTLTSSDVDASATKTWTIADATPSTTYGSISIVSGTGVWTYTLNNSLAATQALKEDETVTQSYTARVTDDFGAYVDQTITVTINGTNDVPVVTNLGSDRAGSVTEAGHTDPGVVVSGTPTVTGTLTSSDVDATATKTWSIADATPSTTYGSIAIVSGTGVWTYTLNNSLAATQALKEGQSVTQTYTARVTDDFGAYVDQTITVTINGTNDVPVVTNAGSALLGSVTEAGHEDDGTVVVGTATATGTLTSSDVDASATKTWTIVDATPSTTYGSIALDASTGVWTYTLDNTKTATQALKEGETVTQSYTARVTDDFGAYVDQTITVTINGTNDVPTISDVAAIGLIEATFASAQSLSANGIVSFNDVDANDVIDITTSLTTQAVWNGGTIDSTLKTLLEAGFTASTTDATPGSIGWAYTVNSANLDFLMAGETITLTYTLTATDKTDAKVSDTVTITITGTNDAPVLGSTALYVFQIEDDPTPVGAVGTPVSEFIVDVYDMDLTTPKGVAISSVDDTHGDWYYTTDGTTWVAFPSNVSLATSALLLAADANTRVYFKPDLNWNGDVNTALTLHAWDQSTGTAGTQASLAATGGSTAFSTASRSVLMKIQAVNDAPVFNQSGPSTLDYVFNGPQVLNASLAVYDVELGGTNSAVDNYDAAALTVSRVGGANSADQFLGMNGLILSGTSVVYNGSTVGRVTNSGGQLVITFNTNATQDRVNGVLQNIGYANTASASDSDQPVSLQWVFSDMNNNRLQGRDGVLTDSLLTTVTLKATTGPLNLLGSAGIDSLVGGSDADNLNGGAGVDVMNGKGGSDLYLIGSSTEHASAEIADDGADGTDEVRFTSITAGQTLTLYAADTGIERVVIGTGAGATADTSATTVLSVNASQVTNALAMVGNGGVNTLTGGLGNDTLTGNGGNDTFNVDAGSDTVTDLATGDVLKVLAGATATVNDVAAFVATALTSNAGTATLNAASAGGAIDMRLASGTAGFALVGGAGVDTLIGSKLNDTLTGGAGDTLTGFGGIDTYNITGGTVSVTDLGLGGAGVLKVSAGATVNATVTAAWTATSATQNLGTANIETKGLAVNLALADAVTANAKGFTVTNTASTATTLTGSGLADTLIGGTGADTLVGGAGNDTLTGNTGLDTFVIASGTDTLTDLGSGGAEIIQVSSGATLTATLAAAWTATAASSNSGTVNIMTNGLAVNLGAVSSGSGSFAITNTGAAAVLTGSALVDTITGGTGDDILNGGAGVDILNGGAGSDLYLFGSSADHTMAEIADGGASGTDEVRFTSITAGQTLTLYAADTGIEQVVIGTGTGATAVISGTTALNVDAALVANALTMLGNAGANSLTGTGLADSLNGGAGNDSLIGGAGNDGLTGGVGNDTLTGGADNDTFNVDVGIDTVTDLATGDVLNVSSGASLIATNVEAFVATSSDINAGTATLNAKSTGGSINMGAALGTVGFTLTGAAGADTLLGSRLNDALTGGLGNDTLTGNGGNDTFNVDAGSDTVTDLATGDVLKVLAGATATVNDVAAFVATALTSNAGTATLNAASAGGAIDMRLASGTAGFALIGGAGVDTLIGSKLNDTLTGGAGDTLTGFGGIDTYNITGGTVSVTDLGLGGAGVLKVSAGATVNATVTAAWTATSATQNLGTANIETKGLAVNLALADAVTANAKGFTVTNTASTATTLTGSGLADTLIGGTGVDTLVGGAGADRLLGGLGKDVLTGGTGNDTFAFNNLPTGTTNFDTVIDFVSGVDKLEFSKSVFTGLAGTSADFVSGAGLVKATTSAQHLIYNITTGILYYDADGSGTGSSAVAIALIGTSTHATLAATDFVFVA